MTRILLALLAGFLLLALSACSAITPPTETAIPPTETPEPEAELPSLSYGADSWQVLSVEACGSVHTNSIDTPDSVLSTNGGAALIRLTVECTTGANLFGVLASLGNPFQAMFLTDQAGQTYPSVTIGGGMLDSCDTNYVIFGAVPMDQTLLSLHFPDMQPVDLPETTYQADCPYQ